MARGQGTIVEGDLSGGLVTEAHVLNFPQNACTDLLDVDIQMDKVIERRKGMDFESPRTNQNTILTDSDRVFTTYLWKSAGTASNTNLLVIQEGNLIYAHVANDSIVSDERVGTVINLESIKAPGAPDTKDKLARFASGKGYLFVTHPYCNPFYLRYDGTSLIRTSYNLRIRDIEGVEDGLAINNRPTTLSDEHQYNLQNQGWLDPTQYAAGVVGENEVFGQATALAAWDNLRNDFPSNADIWYTMQSPGGGVSGALYPYVFRPVTASDSVPRGSSQAPRGRYVLTVWNQDRAGVSSIASIPTVTSSYFRPSSCAFFSGRVWYAGISYEGFSHKLYFSQVAEEDSYFGRCYTANDPTAQSPNDVLATDGGVIAIHDAGIIYDLFVIENNLIVFASNGIWSISGSQGIGFTATDYSISRLSSLPQLESIYLTNVAGTPVWWSLDGIYTLAPNERGSLAVTNISEDKIKSFFLNIPIEARRETRGSYDPISKMSQWLYRSTVPSNQSERTDYDRLLRLNTRTGAWSVYSINKQVGLAEHAIRSVIVITNENGSTFKFLNTYTQGGTLRYTFSQHSNDTPVDWASTTPFEFNSYFITGYKIHGEGSKRFQTNKVTIFTRQSLVDGQFEFRGIWDFAMDVNTNEMTRPQMYYIPADNYKYRTPTPTIPGNGRAVQFSVSSVGRSPFCIAGWSIWETAPSSP